MSLFGKSGDLQYEALVAENEFINSLQLEIEKALDARGMTQADLATAMGVSEARVSQILGGNGKNLQARTIARIAWALNLVPDVRYHAVAPPKTRQTSRATNEEGLAAYVDAAFEPTPSAFSQFNNDNFWTIESPRLVPHDEMEAA